MALLLKNGTVVGFDTYEKNDILIENTKITKIAKNIHPAGHIVMDCTDKHIFAGFLDMHVHLREPGQEGKEDILSGTQAAAKGGYTAVACMPNTNPVCDNKIVLEYIKTKAKEKSAINVYPVCAITKESQGELLTDMNNLYAQGAVAFSDDGKPVKSPHVLKMAMTYAKQKDLPILCHCEDMSLTNNGVMNEGETSTRLGLRGISRSSEEVAVAREILIAEEVGAKVHICHISTKGSVQLIREAKKRGVQVTCETAPHYFSLTDQAALGFNTNAKVNPPLRESEDVTAIIEGLRDGTIDAIATDHAPHTKEDKFCEFDNAAFGISGIETAFSVCNTYLIRTEKITLPRLSRLLTRNPSNILKVSSEGIVENATADITVVDLNKKVTVDSKKFLSKGKNTPFDKMDLFGQVETTICQGRIVFGGQND